MKKYVCIAILATFSGCGGSESAKPVPMTPPPSTPVSHPAEPVKPSFHSEQTLSDIHALQTRARQYVAEHCVFGRLKATGDGEKPFPLSCEVENTGSQDVQVVLYDAIFLSEQGDVVGRLKALLPPVKAGEKTVLSLTFVQPGPSVNAMAAMFHEKDQFHERMLLVFRDGHLAEDRDLFQKLRKQCEWSKVSYVEEPKPPFTPFPKPFLACTRDYAREKIKFHAFALMDIATIGDRVVRVSVTAEVENVGALDVSQADFTVYFRDVAGGDAWAKLITTRPVSLKAGEKTIITLATLAGDVPVDVSRKLERVLLAKPGASEVVEPVFLRGRAEDKG